jgi:teichuronic acid biosynthesis glycosyltransferase TuaC
MRVLELTNMYPTPERPALGTFVHDQVEAVRKEGVKIDVFVVNGWKNKLNYIWGIFRFWARLLTRRYDIIHAHYVFSGIIARTQFFYPVVLTHHGLEAFLGWQRFPSGLITRLVDKVIVRTQEMKDKLNDRKAEIIPAGIDFSLFQPIPREEARQKLNIVPSDRKLVLMLWGGGELRREKRLDIAKSAVSLAQKKDASIELMVLTDKPHDQIPLYMNACDALLLVSTAEGSPNVVKEAMACNLPVVSVPVGDVPDLIGDTEGCYLCSYDPSDVAEKLGLVLKNPGRTDGRTKISHLDQSNIAKRIIAVYQDVLERRNGHHHQRRGRRVEK